MDIQVKSRKKFKTKVKDQEYAQTFLSPIYMHQYMVMKVHVIFCVYREIQISGKIGTISGALIIMES